MPESWERRIRRAEQLAGEGGPAESLLTFYAQLLRIQKDLYDSFKGRLSASLNRDLPVVRERAVALLRGVAEHGPDQLAIEARTLLDGDPSAIDGVLVAYWRAPADRQFFAKAVLQPYGQSLVDAGVVPSDRVLTRTDNRCPRCGGAPQLSIVDMTGAASADGGSRQLLCADCLTPWPFRRVVCVHCGEEDEGKLGYFHSPAYEHLRVDVCDMCRHYVKSVDLARLGIAVPLVDEVAGAPLDLWACERGYRKIELNLVGL